MNPSEITPAGDLTTQQHLLEQLDDAVKEVFALMLHSSCIPQTRCCSPAFGFTAVVRFSGSLRGACAIRLDQRTAVYLAEELMGAPLDDPSTRASLSADTAGEICNMIAGSWKSRLVPGLATCALSSPDVHAGSCIPTSPPSRALFGHSFKRFYRFEDHCLTLNLSME